jgi:hypothetical protein
VSSFGLSPLHLIFNNMDVGQRRFHFIGHGACFFLLPSFHLFSFNFVLSCPLLVSLPFICYLTNKHLGHRWLHFIGQGTCLFYFVPSCPLLVSLHFICYLTNKDLGHRRFHFTRHDACFFFFFPLFTILFFIWFLGVLFWFLSPSFLI